ncbi:unnamed protein product [Polarella glacialis]|uniref:Uncharacterized protein n=1 Tax=Polarella glacialis TaxID=89957 RepID=A0A813I5Q1_POLGL|nr:unnamed protein product [Polarella glacialis]
MLTSAPHMAAARLLLLLGLCRCSRAERIFGAGLEGVALLSLDSEVSDLHSSVEENWLRLASLTEKVRLAGHLDAPLSGAAQGGKTETMHDFLSMLNEELSAMQQLAMTIGETWKDSTEMTKSLELSGYVQRLRDFHPKVKSAVLKLEKRYGPSDVRRTEESSTTSEVLQVCANFSAEEIRARARTAVAEVKASKLFKSKAMQVVSDYRERQLQMQDRQQELRNALKSWSKEDWPVKVSDAKLVSDV